MQKSISILIDKVDDRVVSGVLLVYVNKNTGNITISHALSCGVNLKICPSTNKKLKCTNQHAIDTLRKQKVFREHIGVDKIRLEDSISGEKATCYIDINVCKDGRFYINSGFKPYSGRLKRIKENWYQEFKNHQNTSQKAPAFNSGSGEGAAGSPP